jgi:hypothetical protein
VLQYVPYAFQPESHMLTCWHVFTLRTWNVSLFLPFMRPVSHIYWKLLEFILQSLKWIIRISFPKTYVGRSTDLFRWFISLHYIGEYKLKCSLNALTYNMNSGINILELKFFQHNSI